MWKIKPPLTWALEVKYRPVLESLVAVDPMSHFHLKRGSPEEEFPDLARNATWMGRILTLAMYRRQFHRCTQSGVLFDDVIRPGLEEPGLTGSVGCVAGDGECYILFCDFFDRVIEAYHQNRISSSPVSDLNHDNLKGGASLDRMYAASCRVSLVRAVEDFSFPTHCSRGERRQLLTLANRALEQLAEELPGRLFSMEELHQQQQREVPVEGPSRSQLKTGVARDWPDGRAVWISTDGSLVVWVNTEDHLKLVSTREDANLNEAFKVICTNLARLEALYKKLRHPFIWKHQLGWVTSSPANVGTGLRVEVCVKLQHLPNSPRLQEVLKRLRINLETTDSPGLYRVSNAATFGPSEVELTQLVVDGVKLLIAMEKRLQGGAGIDDLVPTQK